MPESLRRVEVQFMGGCRVHKKTTDRKSLLALRALAESRKPEVSVSMGAWSYKSGPGSQTLFRPQPEKAASGGLGTAEHESHSPTQKFFGTKLAAKRDFDIAHASAAYRFAQVRAAFFPAAERSAALLLRATE
jgi:hypothetical protein